MSADTVVSAGDTAWVLVSAALVMLMVPGLAFFYGGLVRKKSTLNTLMMSMAALGVISVQWVVIGYSLAFSPGSPIIGGPRWAGFALRGREPERDVRGDDSASRVRGVPGDVRGDHDRAGLGRGGGADEASGVSALHAALERR